MPFKNKEQHRQYMKDYMRRKRQLERKEAEKQKEKEIEAHIRMGDLNFGIPCKKPQFLLSKEWRELNPHGKFSQYRKEQKQFNAENSDYGEPMKPTSHVLSDNEKAYSEGLGMSEDAHCRKLREAFRNAKNRMWRRELEQQLREDCGYV